MQLQVLKVRIVQYVSKEIATSLSENLSSYLYEVYTFQR